MFFSAAAISPSPAFLHKQNCSCFKEWILTNLAHLGNTVQAFTWWHSDAISGKRTECQT